MSDGRTSDWTRGAPKWAAVVVVAALCVGAMGYAAGRDRAIELSWSDAALVRTDAAQEVPARNEAEAAAPLQAITQVAPVTPSKPVAAPVRVININTASAAELELLPGVGPALAKRIIDHRIAYGRFKRVSDLDAVKGIGPRLIGRIRTTASVD